MEKSFLRRGISPVSTAAWLVACCILLALPAPAATLCFEAELADELDFPFEIAEIEGASGGLAISTPEGSGSNEAMGGRRSAAVYRIPIPKDGIYLVLLRVRWNGVCSNSLLLTVDKGERQVVADNALERWHWVVSNPWTLKAGLTELRIENREDGILVDQIALTTEKLEPDEGTLEANLIPGPADDARVPLRLFAGTGPEGAQDRKGPDFFMSHDAERVTALDPARCLVLRPPASLPLRLWVRGSAHADETARVSVHTEAPVRIKPQAEQTFTAGKAKLLVRLAFDLSADANAPRSAWPLFVRLHHADGRIEGQKIVLVRPFEWLVTNAMGCPEPTGIDTPSPVEPHLERGFPGAAPGIDWKVAPDDAVTPLGLLDMRRAVADRTHVMAYAYTALDSPDAGEYLLDVRHDDMIRIWVNGKAVFTSTRCAPADLTRRLVKVSLRKGANDVLVKICQRRNFWEFGLQVRTVDGDLAPVTGREVASLVTAKAPQ